MLLLIAVGCAVAPPQDAPAPAPDGRERIERFAADRSILGRRYDVPLSTRRPERLGRFLEDALREVEATDLSKLPLDARVDAVLLRDHLRHEILELRREEKADAEVRALVPFWDELAALEESRRRFETPDPAASARVLDAAAGRIAAARKALEAAGAKTGRVLARRAARRVEQLRGTLREWNRFHAGYHPEHGWWCAKPYERVDKDLEGLAAFLRDKVAREKDEGADGLVGEPIGREGLLEELALERIPYSPEELIAAGEREFAWCEARMREAARDLGFGDDWKKALEHVKSKFVPPGKQPELIRDLALEAERFVTERNLVTVPPLARETWRMEMMPPERQRTTPYFTGGEVISVSYPTDGMSHEQKLMSLRGNNRSFCRATVHHELIPGHHLQLFMAERHRPYRRLFRTPFVVEGWCLYWELRLWDLGFARDAEDRVGMLFWRAHRGARIVVSLKFHLGVMAPREMVDFLVDRVGHERDGALAEVRRYIGGSYGPLYQAAYLLGGMQIRALHQELVASGRMSERDFHDAVLRENSIPVDLVRASLSGVAPGFDTPPWKFLD
jgi:uncharacterized protein (DUF885 family)